VSGGRTSGALALHTAKWVPLFVAVVCAALLHAGTTSARQQASGVVSKTQAATQKFFDDFALMRYEEYCSQQKLKTDGKIAYKQDTTFDSIMRMRLEEGGLQVDEQQIAVTQPKHFDSRPLLSTRGFSALAMIFHPYYAQSFTFSQGEPDQVGGHTLARINFAHIPDKSSPWLYQMFGGDRPLDLSGTALVDPDTGDIFRIEAGVEPKSGDLVFKKLDAAVTYAPVVLQDEEAARMLPDTATVDLETARQHWRNTYSFKDYRKYRVASSIQGADSQ
jgi:hypothetical protein